MTSDSFPDPAGGPVIGPGPLVMETTGNYLVLFAEDAVEEGLSALGKSAGLSADATVQATADIDIEEVAEAETIVFPDLGVGVFRADPDQVRGVAVASHDTPAILAIEPERVVYAIEQTTVPPEIGEIPLGGSISPDYLRGYRDAIDGFLRSIEGISGVDGAGLGAQATWDETAATWGLQATRVVNSNFTGRGVRVAVLDTGLDLGHPDFGGRSIASASFIAGEQVQDGHGHGTHCIGTACGPLQPQRLPRYGVAHEAEIFAGKVLSNRGSGADGGILAGINWAVGNRCRVVSMSLGAPTQVGAPFSHVFETVARRALRAGTAIFAAAGNDSRRPMGIIQPVSHPANCPSILAVAAVDDQFAIATFSNRGLNPNGGQIDVAGPGVRVYSSWPRPTLYNTINGTSMATPHVAGIAALYGQANPTITAGELSCLVVKMARRLPLPSSDVGSGLVQAP